MTAFLDLFSGIGGFALAAHRAGLRFNHHYFSEVNEYAVKVYQKNFPDALQLGDIRKVDYEQLREEIMGGLSIVNQGDHTSLHQQIKKEANREPPADILVCGGFPVPASPTPLPESGKGRRTSAIYGLNVQECCANYDPASRSLRTFQASLFQMEDNSSTEFLATFTRAGMMRNGMLYQLRRWERGTRETGCGLPPMNSVVMFPTPGTTGLSNGSGNCEKVNRLAEQGLITEEERLSMRAGNGGKLNPDWEDWLMGYPIGWSALKPLETPLSLIAPK